MPSSFTKACIMRTIQRNIFPAKAILYILSLLLVPLENGNRKQVPYKIYQAHYTYY